MKMKDFYTKVTNEIASLIEAGTPPWRNQVNEHLFMPRNAYTGRFYSGVNVILLRMVMNSQGYEQSRWLTFSQARLVGAHIKKGEKGTNVVFTKNVLVKDEQGNETTETRPVLRTYTVFNVDQVEDPPERLKPQLSFKSNDALSANVRSFVEALNADIRLSDQKPGYVITGDYIVFPKFEAFPDAATYFSVLFHELAHWTGHKSRLNRELGQRFGNQAYAMEEMIAEMAASFLCSHFDVPMQIQTNASYISTWLEVLEDDDRAVFTAASRASQIVDYLLETANAKPEAA